MTELVLILITCVLLAPLLFFIVQILAAVFFTPPVRSNENADLSRVVVLIPAHNEETVICKTLDSLIPQLSAANQVIVIADNCDDTTAQLALNKGVTVLERANDSELGKGYVLQFGIDYLCQQPEKPEYVVIVDADCEVMAGSINALIQQCSAAKGSPVQALDLMKARAGASKNLKIAEFAWMVKNWVRPLGLMKLGLPCQLMGTGMVFPFELLNRLQLGTSHLAEDMKLGVECALKGFPPVFCPDALVVSYFPESNVSQQFQRQRWEHGHLSVIFSEAANLALRAISSRNKNLLSMAIDLSIPPLALLVLVLGCVLILLAIFAWILNFDPLILNTVTIVSLIFCLSLLVVWSRFARDVVSLTDLIWVPFYVLSKLPIYVGFWFRKQTRWIRTHRD